MDLRSTRDVARLLGVSISRLARAVTGLADAMNDRRDAKVREVLACYVERIVVTPSTKSGILAINASVCGTGGYKKNDHSEERSCVKLVAGARYVPLHIRLAFWRRFQSAA